MYVVLSTYVLNARISSPELSLQEVHLSSRVLTPSPSPRHSPHNTPAGKKRTRKNKDGFKKHMYNI